MDFAHMHMAIQLDRTFHEDAMAMNAFFSPSHFITLLIEHDYIKKDKDIPVLRTPIYITDSDMDLYQKVLTKFSTIEEYGEIEVRKTIRCLALSPASMTADPLLSHLPAASLALFLVHLFFNTKNYTYDVASCLTHTP